MSRHSAPFGSLRAQTGVALVLSALGLIAGPLHALPSRSLAQAAPSSRLRACPVDEGLSEAATSLLLDDVAPTRAALRSALSAAGSDLLAVRALRAPLSDNASLLRFMRVQAELADAPLVCGEAVSETTRLVLVATRAGSLDAGDSGVAATLRVTLSATFADAYLAGRDAEGRHHRWAVDAQVLSEGFVVPADIARPVLVQLVATGPEGPRPVAQRWVGERADMGDAATDLGPSVDGADDLPTRVATLRSYEGASELRQNRLLMAEASAHAARVCASGRVRHGSRGDANPANPAEPANDDPRERLSRRGVSARVVGETVARGRDLRGALEALSESPSHRMTLVDRRFTDVGYGTATAHGATCVVALFAAWPRYVPHR